jgi:hypothetical protein
MRRLALMKHGGASLQIEFEIAEPFNAPSYPPRRQRE